MFWHDPPPPQKNTNYLLLVSKTQQLTFYVWIVLYLNTCGPLNCNFHFSLFFNIQTDCEISQKIMSDIGFDCYNLGPSKQNQKNL